MPCSRCRATSAAERVKANIAPLMQGLGRAKPGDWLLTLLPSLRTAEIAHKALALRSRSLSRSLGCGRTLRNGAEDPLNAEKAFRLVMSWCNSHQNRFIGREMDDRTAVLRLGREVAATEQGQQVDCWPFLLLHLNCNRFQPIIDRKVGEIFSCEFAL